MGFLKDLRAINRQAKELGEKSDPGARMREMNEKLAAQNALLAPTVAQPAPPAP